MSNNEKHELMAKVVFYMYCGLSLMTIATASQSEVLVFDNFRNEKEILKTSKTLST